MAEANLPPLDANAAVIFQALSANNPADYLSGVYNSVTYVLDLLPPIEELRAKATNLAATHVTAGQLALGLLKVLEIADLFTNPASGNPPTTRQLFYHLGKV